MVAGNSALTALPVSHPVGPASGSPNHRTLSTMEIGKKREHEHDEGIARVAIDTFWQYVVGPLYIPLWRGEENLYRLVKSI